MNSNDKSEPIQWNQILCYNFNNYNENIFNEFYDYLSILNISSQSFSDVISPIHPMQTELFNFIHLSQILQYFMEKKHQFLKESKNEIHLIQNQLKLEIDKNLILEEKVANLSDSLVSTQHKLTRIEVNKICK